MSKSKKIFLIASVIFFIIIALIAYDIASRTSFPGSTTKDSVNNIEEVNPMD